MNYNIGKLLGKGKFGAVYSGKSTTGECVAIKFEPMVSSQNKQFNGLRRETTVLNYLYHAGCRQIPNVYWFGVYNSSPCLVMTCYECSLHDLGQIPIHSANSFLKQMNTILDCIHSHSVIHRDIKPHNFMIKNKELFIIDFGMAIFEPDSANTTHIIGTPSYISINIHEGKPATQNDDKLSLQYIYLYLTEGLPWANYKYESDIDAMHILHPKNQYIYTIKTSLYRNSLSLTAI